MAVSERCLQLFLYTAVFISVSWSSKTTQFTSLREVNDALRTANIELVNNRTTSDGLNQAELSIGSANISLEFPWPLSANGSLQLRKNQTVPVPDLRDLAVRMMHQVGLNVSFPPLHLIGIGNFGFSLYDFVLSLDEGNLSSIEMVFNIPGWDALHKFHFTVVEPKLAINLKFDSPVAVSVKAKGYITSINQTGFLPDPPGLPVEVTFPEDATGTLEIRVAHKNATVQFDQLASLVSNQIETEVLDAIEKISTRVRVQALHLRISSGLSNMSLLTLISVSTQRLQVFGRVAIKTATLSVTPRQTNFTAVVQVCEKELVVYMERKGAREYLNFRGAEQSKTTLLMSVKNFSSCVIGHNRQPDISFAQADGIAALRYSQFTVNYSLKPKMEPTSLTAVFDLPKSWNLFQGASASTEVLNTTLVIDVIKAKGGFQLEMKAEVLGTIAFRHPVRMEFPFAMIIPSAFSNVTIALQEGKMFHTDINKLWQLDRFSAGFPQFMNSILTHVFVTKLALEFPKTLKGSFGISSFRLQSQSKPGWDFRFFQFKNLDVDYWHNKTVIRGQISHGNLSFECKMEWPPLDHPPTIRLSKPVKMASVRLFTQQIHQIFFGRKHLPLELSRIGLSHVLNFSLQEMALSLRDDLTISKAFFIGRLPKYSWDLFSNFFSVDEVSFIVDVVTGTSFNVNVSGVIDIIDGGIKLPFELNAPWLEGEKLLLRLTRNRTVRASFNQLSGILSSASSVKFPLFLEAFLPDLLLQKLEFSFDLNLTSFQITELKALCISPWDLGGIGVLELKNITLRMDERSFNVSGQVRLGGTYVELELTNVTTRPAFRLAQTKKAFQLGRMVKDSLRKMVPSITSIPDPDLLGLKIVNASLVDQAEVEFSNKFDALTKFSLDVKLTEAWSFFSSCCTLRAPKMRLRVYDLNDIPSYSLDVITSIEISDANNRLVLPLECNIPETLESSITMKLTAPVVLHLSKLPALPLVGKSIPLGLLSPVTSVFGNVRLWPLVARFQPQTAQMTAFDVTLSTLMDWNFNGFPATLTNISLEMNYKSSNGGQFLATLVGSFTLRQRVILFSIPLPSPMANVLLMNMDFHGSLEISISEIGHLLLGGFNLESLFPIGLSKARVSLQELELRLLLPLNTLQIHGFKLKFAVKNRVTLISNWLEINGITADVSVTTAAQLHVAGSLTCRVTLGSGNNVIQGEGVLSMPSDPSKVWKVNVLSNAKSTISAAKIVQLIGGGFDLKSLIPSELLSKADAFFVKHFLVSINPTTGFEVIDITSTLEANVSDFLLPLRISIKHILIDVHVVNPFGENKQNPQVTVSVVVKLGEALVPATLSIDKDFAYLRIRDLEKQALSMNDIASLIGGDGLLRRIPVAFKVLDTVTIKRLDVTFRRPKFQVSEASLRCDLNGFDIGFSLPLPLVDSNNMFKASLEVQHFDLNLTQDSTWELIADIQSSFTGIPSALAGHFAQVPGSLTVTPDLAEFKITKTLMDVTVSMNLAGISCNLNINFFDPMIAFWDPSQPEVGIRVSVTGFDALNSLLPFKVFEDRLEMMVSISENKGLLMRLNTFPILEKVIPCQKDKEIYTCDFTWLCQKDSFVKLRLPALGYTKDGFTAAVDVQGLEKLCVPLALPFLKEFFKQIPFLSVLFKQNIPLWPPPDIISILRRFGVNIDNIPKGMAKFRSPEFPQEVSFLLSVAEDGPLKFSLEVQNGKSIDIMLPVSGTTLSGISFRKFTIGEIFGLPFVDVDVEVYVWHLHFLILLSRLPKENPLLINGEDMETRIICKDCFFVILGPYPVPIFAAPFSLEYATLVDAKASVFIYHRRPDFQDFGTIAAFLKSLLKFYTTRDYLLTLNDFGSVNSSLFVVKFSQGKNLTMVQLPKVIGGQQLTLNIPPFDGKTFLIGWMNFFKTLEPGWLLKTIPIRYRVFDVLLKIGPFKWPLAKFAASSANELKKNQQIWPYHVEGSGDDALIIASANLGILSADVELRVKNFGNAGLKLKVSCGIDKLVKARFAAQAMIKLEDRRNPLMISAEVKLTFFDVLLLDGKAEVTKDKISLSGQLKFSFLGMIRFGGKVSAVYGPGLSFVLESAIDLDFIGVRLAKGYLSIRQSPSRTDVKVRARFMSSEINIELTRSLKATVDLQIPLRVDIGRISVLGRSVGTIVLRTGFSVNLKISFPGESSLHVSFHFMGVYVQLPALSFNTRDARPDRIPGLLENLVKHKAPALIKEIFTRSPKLLLRALIDGLLDFGGNVADLVTDLLTLGLNLGENLLKEINNFLESFADAAETLAKAVAKAAELAEKTAKRVREMAEKGLESAKEAVGQAVKGAEEVGKRLIGASKDLGNAIQKVIRLDGVSSEARRVLKNISKALKQTIKAITDIGNRIADEIARGLRNLAGKVVKVFRGLFGKRAIHRRDALIHAREEAKREKEKLLIDESNQRTRVRATERQLDSATREEGTKRKVRDVVFKEAQRKSKELKKAQQVEDEKRVLVEDIRQRGKCVTKEHNCHPNATCLRSGTDGQSFKCVCRRGWIGDGLTCNLPIKNVVIMSDSPKPVGEAVSLSSFALSGTHVRYKYNFQGSFSKYGFATRTFNSPGIHHLDILAKNNVSNATASTTIIVQVPVSNVTLRIRGDRKACRAIELIPSANGTNVSFAIDFGDNTSSKGIVSAVKHYFPYSGEFTVTVTGSNLVSSRNKTFTLRIVPSHCDELYCDIQILEARFPDMTFHEIASLAWHLSLSGNNDSKINKVWKFLAVMHPLPLKILDKLNFGGKSHKVKSLYSLAGQEINVGFALAGLLSSSIDDLHSLNESLVYIPFIKQHLHTFTWIAALVLNKDDFTATWNTSKSKAEFCQEFLPLSTIYGALDGFVLGKVFASVRQGEKVSNVLHDYYCPSKNTSKHSWLNRHLAFYNLSRILGDNGNFDPIELGKTFANLSSNLDGFASPVKDICLGYFIKTLILGLNITEYRKPSGKIVTACQVYTTCEQCLFLGPDVGCSWCEENKQCVHRSAGINCSKSLEFGKESCPKNCYLKKSCSHCVPQQDCGWCNSPLLVGDSFCTNGGPIKPQALGTCDKAEWHYGGCTKECPWSSGKLCNGKGFCFYDECHCLPGFYGRDCALQGCAYRVGENDTIPGLSKRLKIRLDMENSIVLTTPLLAANSYITIPVAENNKHCLNRKRQNRFHPLFPRRLRLAENMANTMGFCGLFGSLVHESQDKYSCNAIKSRNNCQKRAGCVWSVREPCTGMLLNGCFRLARWLELVVHLGQTIFSPISGNVKTGNNSIEITGWPSSEWEGYAVRINHFIPLNLTSVHSGQILGTALPMEISVLPSFIQVDVVQDNAHKDPLVYLLPCSPACSQVLYSNNGVCDQACNTEECGFDNGECIALYSNNSLFSLKPQSMHDYYSVSTLNIIYNLQRITEETYLNVSQGPLSVFALAKLILHEALGSSRIPATLVYNNYHNIIFKSITFLVDQNLSIEKMTLSIAEKLMEIGFQRVSPYGRAGSDYDVLVIHQSTVQNLSRFKSGLDALMEAGVLQYSLVQISSQANGSYFNIVIDKKSILKERFSHFDPTVEPERACDSLTTCSGHGVCLVNGSCRCDLFYSGSNCQINDCPGRCSGRGTCIDGVCACNIGWDGKDCSKVKLCTTLCPESWIGDGVCDPNCNNPTCFHDKGDCQNVCICPVTWLTDGSCDQTCNNTECEFDGGDCLIEECSSGCKSEVLGDGICDHVCNTEQCDLDSGDCNTIANCTCSPSLQGNGMCNEECNTGDCMYDYGDCTTQVTEADCPATCSPPMIGNGFCDLSCNSSLCNFDGGDCNQTASASSTAVCSEGCLHSFRGDSVCDSVCNVQTCEFDNGDCPQPFIQECSQDCRLDMVGDGVCQSQCQVEECSFDASDCQCAPGCSNSSVGDGTCDIKCFVAPCDYDKMDCGCSQDICPESSIGNGHCDVNCNNRVCNFDGGDCTCSVGCSITSISDGTCDSPCDTQQCQFDGLDCGGCDSEFHSTMCDENAKCVVTGPPFPSVTCQCEPGYYGNGFSCIKRGNCFNSSDVCSINGICVHSSGTSECYCNPGWVGNGVFCENVDECTEQIHNCSVHADCVDLPGSYNCACREGWAGDGSNCTDINECALNTHFCCQNQDCVNSEGNFTCICKSGWQEEENSTFKNESSGRCVNNRDLVPYLSSHCVDVDECTTDVHNCSKYEEVDNAICTNTIGGFQCSCMEGWQGDGYYCTDMDECVDMFACSANQVCKNTVGNYTCSCKNGWMLSTANDTQCEDMDECALGLDDCHTLATCINTDGNFTCECKPGFEDKGRMCMKYECSNQTNLNSTRPRSANISSVSTAEDVCHCSGNFSNSGKICADINECEWGTYDCPPSAPVCQNLPGGYECKCDASNNSTCEPVNPCETSNNTCRHNMTCITIGMEHYCVCPKGYSDDGTGMGCVDTDECANLELYGNCDVNSDCVNLNGSFECRCHPGFYQSEDSCFEIDECEGTITQMVERQLEVCEAGVCASSQLCMYQNSTNNSTNDNATLICACDENSNRNLDCFPAVVSITRREENITTLISIPWYLTKNKTSNFTSNYKGEFHHNCSNRAFCKNTPGSYQCICQDGFQSNDSGRHCFDANECLGNNSCHPNASCFNTFGSYHCECNLGFTGNGLDNCTDEDECALETVNCTHHSSCVNTIGGFFCGCVTGFHRNETLLCEDIDECSSIDLNQCHPRANCVNFVGGYNCSCIKGYKGDGFKCSDIDECRDDSISCGNHSTCYNTLGSYICKCNPGWTGDGKNCSNIDECALGLHTCIENSYCTDNQGSYTCSCYPGWKRQWFEPYGRCSKCDSTTLCSGHGHCLRDGTCDCLSYYGGANCSLCKPDVRCSGHGTCDFNGTCYCEHGWTRQKLDCSVCIPEALCSGHGLCNYDQQTYNNRSCFCDDSYFGKNCSQACPIIKDQVCGPHGYCSRDVVARRPCVCHEGFQWSEPQPNCEDTNECLLGIHSCVSPAICVNTPGSYKCECPSLVGWSFNGTHCNDTNECQYPNVCDPRATCINYPGSFNCSCNRGWRGPGSHPICSDIDECAEHIDRCPSQSKCINTLGSYYCECNQGYEKVSEFQCMDINECNRGIHGCDPNSACVNTPGSWRCQCNSGWYPDPTNARLPVCKDTNECVEDPNACPVQSLCVNSVGSYHCNCLTGWRNRGPHACDDINECSERRYSCPSKSRCVNTPGSYQCHCNTGYGPPITTSTCQDINECSRGQYNCPSRSSCVNTIGSYTCQCHRCYYKSGNACHSDCRQSSQTYYTYVQYVTYSSYYTRCRLWDSCKKRRTVYRSRRESRSRTVWVANRPGARCPCR